MHACFVLLAKPPGVAAHRFLEGSLGLVPAVVVSAMRWRSRQTSSIREAEATLAIGERAASAALWHSSDDSQGNTED